MRVLPSRTNVFFVPGWRKKTDGRSKDWPFLYGKHVIKAGFAGFLLYQSCEWAAYD
jgi:hypothetical protein